MGAQLQRIAGRVAQYRLARVKRSLFISAGHSTTDPGARGHGLSEADVVTELRNIVSFYLLRAGFFHTTDSDSITRNMPLAQAIRMAKRVDIAVEFHCNASEDPKATGVETLGGPADMAQGKAICAAIAKVLGIKNRGAKPEASGQHSRLGFVQAGGLIVELFFITNPSDVAVYQAKKWLVGRAIADVLMTEATR